MCYGNWKEKCILGLPTLFSQRIRQKLRDHCGTTEIPWHNLTYGHFFSFIRMEGLALCTELRIQNKYHSEKKLFRNEIGSFCEHFGYPKLEAPSSKKKKLIKKASKVYPKKYERKNPYYQNPKNTSKGNFFIKKKITPNPFQTQVITCYKCHQISHKTNNCPLKKIMKLEDKKLQKIMLSL